MKIAISSTGTNLDATVDQRFGRCQYFLIIDPETMEYKSIDNAASMASGGAGSSAAQAIAGEGDVEAVLTGNCGPNAFSVLDAAKIRVITGVYGSVKDAVDRYAKGELKETDKPNVADHFGSGGGRGGGQGRRRGMGM
jgi:predicted Fe-Mo cluster-binding NifX family protein